MDYRITFVRGIEFWFSEKPSEPVRSLLKSAGFRWDPRDACWRIRGGIDVDAFCKRLDKLTDPDAPAKPDAPCWTCGDSNGFFRKQGPFTPIYCNACHEVRKL